MYALRAPHLAAVEALAAHAEADVFTALETHRKPLRIDFPLFISLRLQNLVLQVRLEDPDLVLPWIEEENSLRDLTSCEEVGLDVVATGLGSCPAALVATPNVGSGGKGRFSSGGQGWRQSWRKCWGSGGGANTHAVVEASVGFAVRVGDTSLVNFAFIAVWASAVNVSLVTILHSCLAEIATRETIVNRRLRSASGPNTSGRIPSCTFDTCNLNLLFTTCPGQIFRRTQKVSFACCSKGG